MSIGLLVEGFDSALCRILLIPLLVAFGVVTAMAQNGAYVKAHSVTIRQGNTVMVTLISNEGTASTQFEISANNREPVRGAIVRNDGRVFGLDYRNATYTTISLDEAVARQQAERATVLRGLIRPDLAMTSYGFPPPSLTSLPRHTNIHGIRAQGYELEDGGKTWRLYYAIGLPRPPSGIRSKLAHLSPVVAATATHHCSHDDDNQVPDSYDGDSVAAAYHVAGRALLRAEIAGENGWTNVFEVEEVSEVRVPSASFAPLPSWHSVIGSSDDVAPLPLGIRKAHATSQPASTRYLSFFPEPQTLAHVIQGPGPTIGHPELYLYFWGPTFNEPTHATAVHELASSFQRIFDPRYSGFLTQYGVGMGRVIRLRFDTDNPPGFVGDGGVGAGVGAFVLKEGLNGNSPLFWWTVGGHDPLFVVFVPENDVNKAAWDGVHLVAPNLVIAVVPFPFNLFVHQGMPYILVKVPNASLTLAPAALLLRDTYCHGKTPPVFCSDISHFDDATARTAHEYVEAVSDPLPFFGWSDPLKQPAAAESEIADICRNAPLPWGRRSRVGETVLSTFWSNLDTACVPESRPKITIFEPLNASTIPWHAGGATTVLRAFASDPIDGELTPIEWSVDGGPPFSLLGIPSVNSLSLGAHTVVASATNSQGLHGEAKVIVNVSAQPPVARILSPANGATVGAGDLIVFRGYGFDYQDGLLPDSSLIWTVNRRQIGTGRLFSSRIMTVGVARVELTVTNSAGESVGWRHSIHVTEPQNNPSVVILTPANESFYRFDTDVINFTATALDGSGAPLSGSSVTWSSDFDGFLGTGTSLQHTLRGGPCGIATHNVTVTVTDSTGKTASDTVIVYVGQIC